MTRNSTPISYSCFSADSEVDNSEANVSKELEVEEWIKRKWPNVFISIFQFSIKYGTHGSCVDDSAPFNLQLGSGQSDRIFVSINCTWHSESWDEKAKERECWHIRWWLEMFTSPHFLRLHVFDMEHLPSNQSSKLIRDYHGIRIERNHIHVMRLFTRMPEYFSKFSVFNFTDQSLFIMRILAIPFSTIRPLKLPSSRHHRLIVVPAAAASWLFSGISFCGFLGPGRNKPARLNIASSSPRAAPFHHSPISASSVFFVLLPLSI